MRGDSLRDFYAKALALFGLALLGALGAAVDYWPANVSIPNPKKLNFQAATLKPLENVTLPEPRAVAPRLAAARPAVASIAVASEPAVIETVAMTIEPPAPPAELQLAPPASFTGLRDATDAAVDLTALEPLETFQITAVAPQAPAQKSMLGALGSSIGNAGSVVVDGIQLVGNRVGGALKGGASKLWPFKKSDDRQRQMLGPGRLSAASYR